MQKELNLVNSFFDSYGIEYTAELSQDYTAIKISNPHNAKQSGLFRTDALVNFLEGIEDYRGDLWEQMVSAAEFQGPNPRLVRANREALEAAGLRDEVYNNIIKQAKEELCTDAEVRCYKDTQNGRLYACCPHSHQCLELAAQETKAKEVGVTADGELVVNKKKSKPMGLGKARRMQLAEEAKNPKPEPVHTEQIWNATYEVWETHFIGDD